MFLRPTLIIKLKCLVSLALLLGPAHGEDKFTGLYSYKDDIIKLVLGDGNIRVYTSNFKLSWTADLNSTRRFIEYIVTGQLDRTYTIMDTVNQIDTCYNDCLLKENCFLAQWNEWFRWGICKKYAVADVTFPILSLSIGISPQLVRFVQRKYTDPAGGPNWVAYQTWLYIRIPYSVKYTFSFAEPYNSGSLSNEKAIKLTQKNIEDSFFVTYCKPATVVFEPIMCTLTTDYTFSAAGEIVDPNWIAWSLSDTTNVSNAATISSLGRGVVFYSKKFYFTAAGTKTVDIQATKNFIESVITILIVYFHRLYLGVFNFT